MPDHPDLRRRRRPDQRTADESGLPAELIPPGPGHKRDPATRGHKKRDRRGVLDLVMGVQLMADRPAKGREAIMQGGTQIPAEHHQRLLQELAPRHLRQLREGVRLREHRHELLAICDPRPELRVKDPAIDEANVKPPVPEGIELMCRPHLVEHRSHTGVSLPDRAKHSRQHPARGALRERYRQRAQLATPGPPSGLRCLRRLR